MDAHYSNQVGLREQRARQDKLKQLSKQVDNGETKRFVNLLDLKGKCLNAQPNAWWAGSDKGFIRSGYFCKQLFSVLHSIELGLESLDCKIKSMESSGSIFQGGK